MSDAPAKIYNYRLITMNGIVVDFQSPNGMEALWTIIKGMGYFVRIDAAGREQGRIPFHAIADLEYRDEAAMIFAPSASMAKN